MTMERERWNRPLGAITAPTFIWSQKKDRWTGTRLTFDAACRLLLLKLPTGETIVLQIADCQVVYLGQRTGTITKSSIPVWAMKLFAPLRRSHIIAWTKKELTILWFQMLKAASLHDVYLLPRTPAITAPQDNQSPQDVTIGMEQAAIPTLNLHQRGSDDRHLGHSVQASPIRGSVEMVPTTEEGEEESEKETDNLASGNVEEEEMEAHVEEQKEAVVREIKLSGYEEAPCPKIYGVVSAWLLLRYCISAPINQSTRIRLYDRRVEKIKKRRRAFDIISNWVCHRRQVGCLRPADIIILTDIYNRLRTNLAKASWKKDPSMTPLSEARRQLAVVLQDYVHTVEDPKGVAQRFKERCGQIISGGDKASNENQAPTLEALFWEMCVLEWQHGWRIPCRVRYWLTEVCVFVLRALAREHIYQKEYHRGQQLFGRIEAIGRRELKLHPCGGISERILARLDWAWSMILRNRHISQSFRFYREAAFHLRCLITARDRGHIIRLQKVWREWRGVVNAMQKFRCLACRLASYYSLKMMYIAQRLHNFRRRAKGFRLLSGRTSSLRHQQQCTRRAEQHHQHRLGVIGLGHWRSLTQLHSKGRWLQQHVREKQLLTSFQSCHRLWKIQKLRKQVAGEMATRNSHAYLLMAANLIRKVCRLAASAKLAIEATRRAEAARGRIFARTYRAAALIQSLVRGHLCRLHLLQCEVSLQKTFDAGGLAQEFQSSHGLNEGEASSSPCLIQCSIVTGRYRDIKLGLVYRFEVPAAGQCFYISYAKVLELFSSIPQYQRRHWTIPELFSLLRETELVSDLPYDYYDAVVDQKESPHSADKSEVTDSQTAFASAAVFQNLPALEAMLTTTLNLLDRRSTQHKPGIGDLVILPGSLSELLSASEKEVDQRFIRVLKTIQEEKDAAFKGVDSAISEGYAEVLGVLSQTCSLLDALKGRRKAHFGHTSIWTYETALKAKKAEAQQSLKEITKYARVVQGLKQTDMQDEIKILQRRRFILHELIRLRQCAALSMITPFMEKITQKVAATCERIDHLQASCMRLACTRQHHSKYETVKRILTGEAEALEKDLKMWNVLYQQIRDYYRACLKALSKEVQYLESRAAALLKPSRRPAAKCNQIIKNLHTLLLQGRLSYVCARKQEDYIQLLLHRRLVMEDKAKKERSRQHKVSKDYEIQLKKAVGRRRIPIEIHWKPLVICCKKLEEWIIEPSRVIQNWATIRDARWSKEQQLQYLRAKAYGKTTDAQKGETDKKVETFLSMQEALSQHIKLYAEAVAKRQYQPSLTMHLDLYGASKRVEKQSRDNYPSAARFYQELRELLEPAYHEYRYIKRNRDVIYRKDPLLFKNLEKDYGLWRSRQSLTLAQLQRIVPILPWTRAKWSQAASKIQRQWQRKRRKRQFFFKNVIRVQCMARRHLAYRFLNAICIQRWYRMRVVYRDLEARAQKRASGEKRARQEMQRFHLLYVKVADPNPPGMAWLTTSTAAAAAEDTSRPPSYYYLNRRTGAIVYQKPQCFGGVDSPYDAPTPRTQKQLLRLMRSGPKVWYPKQFAKRLGVYGGHNDMDEAEAGIILTRAFRRLLLQRRERKGKEEEEDVASYDPGRKKRRQITDATSIRQALAIGVRDVRTLSGKQKEKAGIIHRWLRRLRAQRLIIKLLPKIYKESVVVKQRGGSSGSQGRGLKRTRRKSPDDTWSI